MSQYDSGKDYGHDLVNGLGKWAGRKVAQKSLEVAGRLVKRFTKQVILKGIKILIVKTAPFWVPVLLIFFLAWVSFMLIYALPRSTFEDTKEDAQAKVAAFFGFSEEEAKGNENLFETYKEVASGWNDGLSDIQKQQVSQYTFSWAVLAGVDRMRNDPYFTKDTGYGVAIPADVTIDGVKPPTEFISLYQQAGKQFNVNWEVLAAIHFIETTYSTYPTGSVSSVGAVGAMQFMPATWNAYGVDANGDGVADPYNIPDAIFSAANYLNSNQYIKNPSQAIWNYNHAQWYVNEVLGVAELIRQMNLTSDSINIGEITPNNNKSSFISTSKTSPTKLLIPKPKETFEALRPKFTWKDSTITTTWTEKVCTKNNETGEEICEDKEMKKEETVKLLEKAETYEGTYTHTYKTETLQENTKTITKEVNDEIIPPNNYMQPLLDYLGVYNITNDIDIETTFNIIKIYDATFEANANKRESVIVDNYPVIEGSKGWRWPTPSTRITSGFGARLSPCAGCSSYHNAVDIGPLQRGVDGDPVYAPFDGTVITSSTESCGGNYIKIDNGNGVVARFMHLSARLVNKGEKVKKGDLVAKMGNTGSCSSGTHLDFQIKINGNLVDPRYYYSNVAFK